MANQTPYKPMDYTFYRGGRPLQPPNTDPDEWRRIQTLNSILGKSTPMNGRVDIPYENPNPFSPNYFPRYGWYPSTGPSPYPIPVQAHAHTSSRPPPPGGISAATGRPFLLPSKGEYEMYTRDPSLLPTSFRETFTIQDPTVVERPSIRPFGDTSDLSWTSPRTGKTYQLPPMEDRYIGPHHYICGNRGCGKRKMKFEG